MYLLFDECCATALVKFAEALGHTAQRSVDVAGLGRGASDDDVFAFARRGGAIVVTVNRADFVALAAVQDHPGVLLIPSLPTKQLRPGFEALLRIAEPLFAAQPGLIVELDPKGQISSFTV